MGAASLLSTGAQLPVLKIASNKRVFETKPGKTFFWLGDTGWLLFVKCNREEAIQYLDTRKAQGFNIIQVMVIHDLHNRNIYGHDALLNANLATPAVTPGNDYRDAKAYDFWDHAEFIIDEAAKRGIYMALVAVWGSNVKGGNVTAKDAETYARFLVQRFGKKSNIVWLNGGDIKGSDGMDVWKTIGNTLRQYDKTHLIGFHPRGRNSSSAWFHHEPWLDFNMFQSGHRSYAQDTIAEEKLHYGEDNWKYMNDDYRLKPVKPSFDGEPSYEDIPYGLHQANQPYWQDHEIRRYAYWSVLAGGCGFTYGHNAVMQFYSPGDSGTSYFPKQSWQEGLKAPGAGQMHFLKELMQSKNFREQVPAQELVTDNGERYERVAAARGKDHAFFYVYTGRTFTVATQQLKFIPGKASWFRPATGERTVVKDFKAGTTNRFDPPGEAAKGNDWLLILEK